MAASGTGKDEAGGMAAGGGEPGSDEGRDVKPNQLDLLTEMLAAMRQEQAGMRQEQAERASEQAHKWEEIVEHTRQQARLMESMRSSLSSLREESRQYTDQACDSVKSELLQRVLALEGRVEGLSEEVAETSGQSGGRVAQNGGAAADTSRVSDPLDLWGGVQGPMSVASEPVGAVGGWDVFGSPVVRPGSAGPGPSHPVSLPPVSLPPSPPSSPPGQLACERCTPQQSPQSPRRSVRRKPAEYDGKVAWEAYVAQFEMLATAQGWNDAEKALQLATALRGQAVEVLGHLSPAQRASYQGVAEALKRRFGHHLQAEVYRARLKRRTRGRDETLSQLAQDMEALVRRAYPAAPEEMIVVLARDSFVDALNDQQLQIYVKQAHPGDLQVALARALEFEAFMKTSGSSAAAAQPRRDLQGRKATVEKKAASREASPDGFRGSCWSCGERGHKRSQCSRGRRTRSLDRLSSDAFQPCCKECGKSGHRGSACPKPKEVAQAGNSDRLEKGANTQPSVPGPRAV